MNKQFAFTKAKLEALAPASRRVRYRDSKVDGLIVEVMLSGAKIFRVYKKIKGQRTPISVSLGRFPSMSIENARKQALSKIEALSQGVNPNEQKRVEAKADVSMQQVFEDYIQTKKLKPTTLRGYRTLTKTHFKNYMRRPLRAIDESVVRELHASVSVTAPGQADLAMRFLRALFNFAKFEYRGLNNAVLYGHNPVQILSHLKLWNHAPRRQTRLLQTELPGFFKALDEVRSEGDHFAAACCDLVEMALLTGLRRSELLGLQWRAVNRSERTFYLSYTKNGDPLELPISHRLESLIERRYEQRANATWVFSAENCHGVVREPKKVIHKIADKCGTHFTLHDLRRTFTTIAESLNLGSYTIKRLLNHRAQRNDVTAGYTVLTPEELREPSQRIENKLLQLAGLQPCSSEVALQLVDLVAALDTVEQHKLLRTLSAKPRTLRAAS